MRSPRSLPTNERFPAPHPTSMSTTSSRRCDEATGLPTAEDPLFPCSIASAPSPLPTRSRSHPDGLTRRCPLGTVSDYALCSAGMNISHTADHANRCVTIRPGRSGYDRNFVTRGYHLMLIRASSSNDRLPQSLDEVTKRPHAGGMLTASHTENTFGGGHFGSNFAARQPAITFRSDPRASPPERIFLQRSAAMARPTSAVAAPVPVSRPEPVRAQDPAGPRRSTSAGRGRAARRRRPGHPRWAAAASARR